MREQIDVRLESLAGSARPEELPREGASPTGQTSIGASDSASSAAGKTFYLETFGCQMNAHDSEKVAGVLLQRGYSQVETIAAASMVLYNTCSIREKAAHKVFSRLGEFRDADDGKIIGVLGCVAQQEGEKIFKRAPWVSLVCGSASYSKLHGMIQELETGNRRVTGLDNDTDETFETEMTRRDHPFRAYITIIEGCDKACTYCVVPFTRGPERSRASANILEEARRLADAGYTEIQLLGQTVNSYRDPSPRRMSFSEILLAVADVAGDSPRAIHHFSSQRFWRGYYRGDGFASGNLRTRTSPGAIRLHARAARDAAHLFARRIFAETHVNPKRAPRREHHYRCDRRISRRDRRGIRRDLEPARRSSIRYGLFI